MTSICCAAGKSGGHIIPNLFWAQKQYPKAQCLFFSADTPLDFELLNGAVTWHIPLKLPAMRWYLLPLHIIHIAIAILRSFFYLLKHKPEKILSTGGIAAVPVCIAAFCLRIPIELFELNATPGSAIRWLAPLAERINVCFKDAKFYFNPKKVYYTPYPVRFDETLQMSQIFSDSQRKTIFIQGGSQGSISLNKKVKEYIEDNPDICSQIQIIHQTGSSDPFDWKQFYAEKKIPAILFTFEKNIQHYYHAADLLICRAGSGQLFESLFFKKKCITIPLELTYNTHQLENAYALQKEYPELFCIIRSNESLPKGSL